MKYPHLTSAILAITLLGVLLFGWVQYASRLEDREIHVLPPNLPVQAIQGSVLLRAALRQPDLLPVLGSSELLRVDSTNRAANFFADYPTGFNVFVIAKAGATPLTRAQDLAAAGRDLRGKKVVIALTPLVFYHPEVYPQDYAANFWLLHADELAFSPLLSVDLKHEAARRMLAYPDTLSKDPLLRFALHRLAEGSLFSKALYYASCPFGWLETFYRRLQDHRQVVTLLHSQSAQLASVLRRPITPDWTSLAVQAEKEQAALSQSNPYGIEDNIWFDTHKAWVDQKMSPGSGTVVYLQHLQGTQEWTDLDILLRVLDELGARPLILCLPFKGPLMDALGVPVSARLQFYDRLEESVDAYGFPLVDFQRYDGDKYFVIDLFSHTSRKGWVYVDQTLDAFYHGALLDPLDAESSTSSLLP